MSIEYELITLFDISVDQYILSYKDRCNLAETKQRKEFLRFAASGGGVLPDGVARVLILSIPLYEI